MDGSPCNPSSYTHEPTQDGKLPAEFDITAYVHPSPDKANLLAVRVLRWSDGACALT